jgi:hypothetical protein
MQTHHPLHDIAEMTVPQYWRPTASLSVSYRIKKPLHHIQANFFVYVTDKKKQRMCVSVDLDGIPNRTRLDEVARLLTRLRKLGYRRSPNHLVSKFVAKDLTGLDAVAAESARLDTLMRELGGKPVR